MKSSRKCRKSSVQSSRKSRRLVQSKTVTLVIVSEFFFHQSAEVVTNSRLTIRQPYKPIEHNCEQVTSLLFKVHKQSQQDPGAGRVVLLLLAGNLQAKKKRYQRQLRFKSCASALVVLKVQKMSKRCFCFFLIRSPPI